MKKFLALLLSLSMVLALSACGGTKSDDDNAKGDETKTDAPAETATDFKVGFIMLHDENSTYDLNFINAAKEACEKLGVEYKIITNVPEGQECYDKAAELADDGCNIIFADSFGHEDYMIQAAKEFPNVQFCHSTGTKAHTEGLSNYHNAFASIYEGRYLAGVAAGMKLNDMIANRGSGQDGLCRRFHLCRGYLWLHLLLSGRQVCVPLCHHGRDLHRFLV